MAYKDDSFAPREVENAPKLTGSPLQLVLDGQQRLTSLYQAFYGVGDYVYFVDFAALLQAEPSIEDAIVFHPRKRAKSLLTRPEQAARLVMPLGELFGGLEFDGWLEEIMDLRDETGPERTALRKSIQSARREFVRPIEEYRFPVVTLGPKTSLVAVCSIFESLNRSGVKLTVFELLAARYFAQDLDLRGWWSTAKEDYPRLAAFDVNDYYVLQAIALRARESLTRADVLALTKPDIETHWDDVIRGFDGALGLLQSECGVLQPRWLPYAYMLVPMAALWTENIVKKGPGAGANLGKLKQWFWCGSLNARYDRAANTQAIKDHAELRKWFDGGAAPEAVRDFTFVPSRLGEYTPRQQAIYKALMALVLRRSARDFYLAAPLTAESIVARGADDHHVFPKAYLNPPGGIAGYEPQLVDSILNRTLIDKKTNLSIGKRAPSDYFNEVRAALDVGAPMSLDDILVTHGIRSGEGAPVWNDDFDAFTTERTMFFTQLVVSATGKQLAEPKPVVSPTDP